MYKNKYINLKHYDSVSKNFHSISRTPIWWLTPLYLQPFYKMISPHLTEFQLSMNGTTSLKALSNKSANPHLSPSYLGTRKGKFSWIFAILDQEALLKFTLSIQPARLSIALFNVNQWHWQKSIYSQGVRFISQLSTHNIIPSTLNPTVI